MKHYVVLCDWAMSHNDGEVNRECHVTGVAHTPEEAKEILVKAAVDERKYAYEHDWEIHEDSDMCFCAGEQGNYDNEHAHFYIQEVR